MDYHICANHFPISWIFAGFETPAIKRKNNDIASADKKRPPLTDIGNISSKNRNQIAVSSDHNYQERNQMVLLKTLVESLCTTNKTVLDMRNKPKDVWTLLMNRIITN